MFFDGIMLLYVDQWNDIPLNSKFVQIKAPNINLFHFFQMLLLCVCYYFGICVHFLLYCSFLLGLNAKKGEVLNS